MQRLSQLVSLEGLERHPGRTFAAIGALCIVAYVATLTLFPRRHARIVDGDAIQYYAYLRSLVIDGDVDFRNDYRELYRPKEGERSENVWLTTTTATGLAPNMMSIGPALLWAPFFLLVYGAAALLQLAGLAVPLDGLAAPFQLSAGVAGIVYATLGAYLCYRTSCLLALTPPACAFWGALVAWLASPAVYYSLVSPAYSHATSLFAVALFCYYWLNTKGDERLGRYARLGALGGLATLVRWQDVVIFVLPGLEIIHALRQRPRWTLAARVAVLAGAGALMLVPQVLAWRQVYGQFVVMPQGPDFMQWTRPAIVSVLFSMNHGLLTWTPAVAPALLGLAWLVRRDALVGWGSFAVVLVSVCVNASVRDWWAGEAFGARRFVSDTVFFALGLTALAATAWNRRPMALRWGGVCLIVYNLLFLLQYQLFMRGFEELTPYPETVKQIFVDRLTLPWRVLRDWLDW